MPFSVGWFQSVCVLQLLAASRPRRVVSWLDAMLSGCWTHSFCQLSIDFFPRQAISRVLSLNISYDQTDWKGLSRFVLDWEFACECAAISRAKHHTTGVKREPKWRKRRNLCLLQNRATTSFMKQSPACPPNRFIRAKKSCMWDTQGGSDQSNLCCCLEVLAFHGGSNFKTDEGIIPDNIRIIS